MSATIDIATAPDARRWRWPWTVSAAIGAVAATLAVALTNQPYFELVNGWVRAGEPLSRGAVYSSYLLLIGIAVVAHDPAAYAIRLGDTLTHWRAVIAAVVGMAALTAGVLLLIPATPYADAHWVNEVVAVPVTEELVFRGVLVTLLLAVLSRVHGPTAAAILAVAIGSMAFGMGHVANAMMLPASFVFAQVIYAVLIGLVAGALMLRTGSIVPAILVHAAVNGVVVAF